MDGAEVRLLFGKNLRNFRSQAGMSQRDLAKIAALTHNFINDLESGKKWLSPRSFEKIASALKKEPHRFLMPGNMATNIAADSYLVEVSRHLKMVAADLQQRYGIKINDAAADQAASKPLVKGEAGES